MPDIIKSVPFSFVRFDTPVGGTSLDIPYSLPAFTNHDVAFQFKVENDKPIADTFALGVGDATGGSSVALSPTVLATFASYRVRITGLSPFPTLYLRSIQVGAQTVTYDNVLITLQDLKDAFYDDFGVEINGDAFILETNALVVATGGATELGADTTFFTFTKYWNTGYFNVSGIAIDPALKCFTYCILENGTGTFVAASNVFKVVTEEDFTSFVTYKAANSCLEFIYSHDEENRIRLPFYLRQPQFPGTRVVHKKSNGVSQLLSATVEKEYVLETELMPEVFHECLKLALIHDTVTIQNKNIREQTVQVLESDNYNVGWEQEADILVAQGRSKVKVATYGYTNSNC